MQTGEVDAQLFEDALEVPKDEEVAGVSHARAVDLDDPDAEDGADDVTVDLLPGLDDQSMQLAEQPVETVLGVVLQVVDRRFEGDALRARQRLADPGLVEEDGDDGQVLKGPMDGGRRLTERNMQQVGHTGNDVIKVRLKVNRERFLEIRDQSGEQVSHTCIHVRENDTMRV